MNKKAGEVRQLFFLENREEEKRSMCEMDLSFVSKSIIFVAAAVR